MISVKATKATGPGPDAASRYRLAEKSPSRTPFGIGIALAAIGFYLRDLFPSWGGPQPAEPRPVGRDESPRGGIAAGDDAPPVPETLSGSAGPAAAFIAGSAPALRPVTTATISPASHDAGMPRTGAGGGIEANASAARGVVSAGAANDNAAPSAAPSGGSRATGGVAPPAPAGREGDGGGRDGGDDGGGGNGRGEGGGDDGDGGGGRDPDRPEDPDDAGGGDEDEKDAGEEEEEDDDGPKPANRAPVISGPVQLPDGFGCMAVLIGLSELLRNASDPDGDPLSVSNLSVSSGTLTRAGDAWSYDPAAMGSVVFTYEVTDGALRTLQTAHLTVQPAPPIHGTGAADILVGIDCADRIDGGGGDDSIDARRGADVVEGGAGRDHVVAGDGDDTVLGGAGDDVVFGGGGDDRIWGGPGNDRLFGEAGEDVLHGEAGNDLVFGGDGDDLAFGGSGDDTIHGETGGDAIEGESGDDLLTGGAGDDLVLGGEGSDSIEGGAGRDVLAGGRGADAVAGGADDDVVFGDADVAGDAYDGGADIDTLDYSAAASTIFADLAAATAIGADIGRDTASNFEILVLGAGDDSVIDGGAVVVVRMGGGDDRLVAAADSRDDVYDGGAGSDSVDYGAATEALVADLGAGTVAGDCVGSDAVGGFETFVSGAGDDTIRGADTAETIHGGGGDDAIDAGGGADVVHDGTGADVVDTGAGDDRVEATADCDDDAYQGGAGFDTLSYAATTTGITVDLASRTVTGIEVGHDTIGGFEGIVGGSGDDTFIAWGGPTSFRGGGGNDLFDYSQLEAGGVGAEVAHEILDFVVGDRIKLSRYRIFEEVVDTIEDRFEDVYGDDLDDDDMPIRIRHERTDEMRRTYVEADMDRDDHYELSITLHGDHLLMMVEPA